MSKLTVEALTESAKNGQKNNDSQTDEKPTESEEAIAKKEQLQKRELAKQLLELDNQLAQAVKQCKGLLRAQPTLPSLAETFTSTPKDQEKPKPDSPSQN